MHNQSNPVKAAKKQYQKPNFWVLDSYVEGGAGVNVNEATALNTNNGFPAGIGNPGQNVYRAGHPLPPQQIGLPHIVKQHKEGYAWRFKLCLVLPCTRGTGSLPVSLP